MLLFTKLAAPKAPKRRSRAGCASCKEKKKKCDEERPKCARCAERGGECVYEPVRPRQRRKRDYLASSSTTPSTTTTDESGGALGAPRGGEEESNDTTANGGLRHLHIPGRSGNNSRIHQQHQQYDDGYDGYDDDECDGLRQQGWLENPNSSWRSGPAHLMFDEGGSSDDACDMPIFSPLEGGFDMGSLVMQQQRHSRDDVVMSPVLGGIRSGGVYDDDDDEDKVDLIVGSIGMEQVDRRSSFASSTAPSSTAVVMAPRNNGQPRRQQHGLSLQLQRQEQGHGGGDLGGSDLALISPCPVRSPLLEFCAPAFSEFSDKPGRRVLVDHFCNVLSHLIVFREETGNPFQQLVLPLMAAGGNSASPDAGSPVADAVYALASAHREHRGLAVVEGGERSLYYHHRAIQGLAKLIQPSSGKVNKNQVLAAIILLVYYEVLVQRSRTNIIEGHLKGALTVMCSNPEPLDSTGVFLERAFRFYDVIAALSFGTAPLSTAPAAGCLLPFPPLGAPAASPLNNVDTLLGMSTTLWPVIHRLSGLLALRADLDAARAAGHPAKVAVLRTEFETTASAVEAALLGWAPSPPAGWVLNTDEGGDPTKLHRVAQPAARDTGPIDGADGFGMNNSLNGSSGGDQTLTDVNSDAALPHPTSAPPSPSSATTDSARLHSILNNALAYRHSALVHLYRTVHSRPRRHPLVQRHARLALRHCAATVEHGGPMGALLWPLFAAACEATDPADRALARRAFLAIDHRQGMTNITRAWDIVCEVWRRADLFRSGGGAALGDDGEGGGDDGEGGGDEDGEFEDEEDVMDFGGLGGGRRHSHSHGAASRPPSSRRMSDFAFPGRRNGIDMWRRVSEDMGVNVVFG